MEHIKIHVDDVQAYLANQVILLPFVYECFLVELNKLQSDGKISLLPTAVFDLYHIQLTRRLHQRIERAKRRAA